MKGICMNLKKIGVIMLFFVIAVGCVYAADVILRQNQTLKGEGASLSLYSSGSMLFYYNYQTYEGRYGITQGGIADGYLSLYEKDGTKVGSFPFQWYERNRTILWVDVHGTKLYR